MPTASLDDWQPSDAASLLSCSTISASPTRRSGIWMPPALQTIVQLTPLYHGIALIPEIYNPNKNAWSFTAAMHTVRVNHRATLLRKWKSR
jgi:hypothetical protein